MKQYIAKALFVAAAASLALSSCDDNSWNEDYLKGFEVPDNTDVKTVEYTLTATDYSTLAGLSANKALAGEELAAELANVGKLGRFTEAISAEKYAPAFLASTSFPYFSLSNGSAVKLTFNVADALPEELEKMNAATGYTLTESDYKTVYGSDEDYALALSPSNGLNNVTALLAANFPDAEQGDYVVVNYNWSNTDPVFAAVPDEPAKWEPTSVAADIALGDEVTIKGWITGICERGFVLTDASGSVFGYNGAGITVADYTLGAPYEVTATVSSYNKGFQLDLANATVTAVEDETATDYTFPAPKVLTGAEMDQLITRTDNELAQYVQMTGTVAVSGNNINIVVDGAETAKGSAYFTLPELKEQLTDGANVTVTGYFIAIAGGRYMNTVVNTVTTGTAAAAPRRVATVASEVRSAVYYFNGSRWSQPDNTVAVSPDQCKQMAGYTTLTAAQANANLPIFLKVTYPYATEGTQKYVVYDEYKNGYVARQYIYDGTEWAENDGIEQTTLQFVRKDGSWLADPSVVITLPVGKGIEISSTYYQACSDWVYENIDVPLGSTSITSGTGYVTSFGNNEYYSGTSAYQNNVDLRADKAVAQYPEGYEGMSEAEVVALMKKRFEEEVMPGALAKLHPDLTPMDGVQVTVTLNFGSYDGSNHSHTARWEVVGPGEFKFLDCTWNKAE